MVKRSLHRHWYKRSGVAAVQYINLHPISLNMFSDYARIVFKSCDIYLLFYSFHLLDRVWSSCSQRRMSLTSHHDGQLQSAVCDLWRCRLLVWNLREHKNKETNSKGDCLFGKSPEIHQDIWPLVWRSCKPQHTWDLESHACVDLPQVRAFK